ncbi:leucine-rich repeat domain-containing protein [Paramaledivibacter caminithermalis]|uniref:Leucine-rich repeat (LRR) protein n=1 Tax=Paramaledivibacter caminithermalis (strain DSM 15212 / CIP 107654 / DViRD3) TaxID=1121301 RepID=A0A1M6R850_PARC5|nr:leucine-rich repeat domain-containing protein [Paramaledivibacter caminithermalis]SHK28596.1 Leucine-rich repeat (LRR) protein [Paramaledivibacter caminithermalis DSM 15212]
MKKIVLISLAIIIIFSMLIQGYCEDIVVINSHMEKEIIKFDDSNLEAVIRAIINKPKGDILYKEVKDIRKIHASDKDIISLGGLEHFTSLEELLLSKNNITDIKPLSKLHRLKYLNLWKNDIRDITPIKNLTNLEQLDLDSNKISDIEALKELKNLKALRIGSNRLTDISPLASLTNLEYLCLWANKIKDIEPVSKLRELTQLRLAYNEIYDINPLTNLKNLENINLINNRVRDISSLANLTNLKELYLNNNEIVDIEPLKELKNIEKLRLDNNSISNLQGIIALSNLKLLTLSNNDISDIPLLDKMDKIEYLDLRSNKIKDIDGLKDVKSLQKLFLDKNQIYNINILNNKKKLTALSLSDNNIWHIGALTPLTNLEYLNLSNNNIRTLEPLTTMSNLTSLYIDDNYISDITPLEQNINLKSLSLENNAIKQIKTIANLINLEDLNLSGNQIYDISDLKNNISLKILNLCNNRITDFSPLNSLKNLEVIKTIDYLSSKDVFKVEGKVTDIYNDELNGADVNVIMINLNQKNNRLFMDETNKFGEFEIQGVFSGEYKIVFTKKGYKPLISYKNIDSNSNKIKVKLELDSETKWLRKETERTVYNYKEGMEISHVEIRLQEKRLMEIEKFFGVDVKEKLNFYICTYPEEIYELAYNTNDYYALGTYKANTNSVYTIGKAFDFHETCHAVEHNFNPNYNMSLGEGLSIYFGSYEIGSPIVLNRPVDDLARELMIKDELKDISTLLRSFSGKNDYIANGSLVTFLLKRYSVEQFKELFKLLPNKPTEDKIKSIFMEIYKKSVIEMQSEWISYLKGEID